MNYPEEMELIRDALSGLCAHSGLCDLVNYRSVIVNGKLESPRCTCGVGPAFDAVLTLSIALPLVGEWDRLWWQQEIARVKHHDSIPFASVPRPTWCFPKVPEHVARYVLKYPQPCVTQTNNGWILEAKGADAVLCPSDGIRLQNFASDILVLDKEDARWVVNVPDPIRLLVREIDRWEKNHGV